VTKTRVNTVCRVSLYAYFRGGSNETIGGRVRLLQPFWFSVVLAAFPY